MTEPAHQHAAGVCENCGTPTAEKSVQVTMWSGGRLVVIEDVPARVCEQCEEQYYDEDTGAKILVLAGEGFPREKAVRELTVPVFSIAGITVPENRELNTDEYSAS